MQTVNPQETSSTATNPHPFLPDKLLYSTPEVCKILDIEQSTAEQWRLKGIGPKFVRLPGSRLIRYRRQDMMNYITALVSVSSTTEADAVA